MKTCETCRAAVADQVAVCPFCGARFADAPPRPEDEGLELGATGQAPVRLGRPLRSVEAAGPRVVVMGAGVDRGRRRLWPWLLAGALVAGAVGWWWSRPPVFPPMTLRGVAPAAEAPCAGARDCVIVFLAPWDDASVRTEAMLAGLAEGWLDRRVEVVVGAGDAPQMELMARRSTLSTLSTWIDDDDEMVAALGLSVAPTWLRVEHGRITGRVEGTWLPLDAQLARLGIE